MGFINRSLVDRSNSLVEKFANLASELRSINQQIDAEADRVANEITNLEDKLAILDATRARNVRVAERIDELVS